MKLKLLTNQIKFDIETWNLSQTQVKFWRFDLRLDSSSNLLTCQEFELDSNSNSNRNLRLASRIKSTHSSLKLDLTINLISSIERITSARRSEMSSRISLMTTITNAKKMMRISTKTKTTIKIDATEIKKKKTIRNSNLIILIKNQSNSKDYDVESRRNSRISSTRTNAEIVISLTITSRIARIWSRKNTHMK